MGRSTRRKQEKHQKGTRETDCHPLRRHRKWFIGALFSLLTIATVAAWQWKGTLWAYKTAPSFALEASNGQLVSLRDYLGKQEVVLIFYMGAG